MSLFHLFKTAFTRPKELIKAKEKSFGKTFLYFLILSLMFCLPIGVQLIKTITTMRADVDKITEKLPEFSVENNQLTTTSDNAGFIYQTDYLIFSFDPDNKLTAKDIQDELIANVIGIGLLKDKAVLAVNDSNLLASLLPQTLLELPYSSFDSSVVNKSFLQENSRSTIVRPTILLVAFLLLFIPLTFDFMLTILMISLFANIYTRLRRGQLKFSDTLKIVIFTATLPVVVSSFMTILMPSFNSNFLIVFLTLFTYIRVIAPTLPKLPQP